jgi:hypothetical protein
MEPVRALFFYEELEVVKCSPHGHWESGPIQTLANGSCVVAGTITPPQPWYRPTRIYERISIEQPS